MEQIKNESKYLSIEGHRPEIEDLICQLVSESTLIHLTKDDLHYLYKALSIQKRRIISFPKDNESRMDSIIRELTEYASIDFSSFNKVVILIETSDQHPMLMEELNGIEKIISLFQGVKEIIWGLGRNNSIEDKVLLTLVCSN